MEWIISSVQICWTSIFLRSSSRALSAFSNRSSTLRWSSLSRAVAWGFSRLGMGDLGGVAGEIYADNEASQGTFRGSAYVQGRKDEGQACGWPSSRCAPGPVGPLG